MNKLVQRLRDGCIYRKKRWSGDTHFDLGGSIDEERTDALLRESAAAIVRLQPIVDKLPKTKDGVVVLPGDEVFEIMPDGNIRTWIVIWQPHTEQYMVSRIFYDCPIPVSHCYSTREAAEAAKEA